VSETTARKLWPGREAVGQVMRLNAPPQPRTLWLNSEASVPQLPFGKFTVVGVVRDARVGAGMFEAVDADVYVPISAQAAGTSLVLRVHGDPDQARQALIERLSRVDPAMGRITTLRTIAGRATLILQIVFSVAAVLGGLALALTLSGLFGVLSFLVEQRSKEIGVRIALGATTRNIAGLVLSQSVRPVTFGLAAGGGLAGLLATVIVATSPVAGIVKVLDPLAYAASLIVIVTACALAASIPALRAARIDPIATLRND
jgi:ABC-type antimicrobial peptide transport system permease subunit